MGNPYSVGLEVGDQIIGVDGKKVSIMKSFDDLLPSTKKEGDKFDLLILRDGEEMTVTVTMKKIVN